MKKSLICVLLVGCSGPAAPSPDGRDLAADPSLQLVRDALSSARTLRVRYRGEWPYAVGQMPKTVTGTMLLGADERAKITQAFATATGRTTGFEAVCDGRGFWRNDNVAAEKFDPGPTGLRFELLFALEYHGVGWTFPHGLHPKTIGKGFVICDLIPEVRDQSPSRVDHSGAISVVDHATNNVDYRIRLYFDPATRRLHKRELIGDKGKVWYSESYEVELNPAIANDEFKVPEK